MLGGSQFIYADWFSQSKISYPDYLQTREVERSVRFGMDENVKRLIGSNEQINRGQLRVLEQTRDGLVTVSSYINSF